MSTPHPDLHNQAHALLTTMDRAIERADALARRAEASAKALDHKRRCLCAATTIALHPGALARFEALRASKAPLEIERTNLDHVIAAAGWREFELVSFEDGRTYRGSAFADVAKAVDALREKGLIL